MHQRKTDFSLLGKVFVFVDRLVVSHGFSSCFLESGSYFKQKEQ